MRGVFLAVLASLAVVVPAQTDAVFHYRSDGSLCQTITNSETYSLGYINFRFDMTDGTDSSATCPILTGTDTLDVQEMDYASVYFQTLGSAGDADANDLVVYLITHNYNADDGAADYCTCDSNTFDIPAGTLDGRSAVVSWNNGGDGVCDGGCLPGPFTPPNNWSINTYWYMIGDAENNYTYVRSISIYGTS